MGTSRGFYLLLSGLILTLLMRLAIPYSLGSIFSTDAWPIYRDTVIMYSSPSARILDDKRLDGYNNYWPSLILSTALTARIAGLHPRTAYMYILPISTFSAVFISLYMLLTLLTMKKNYGLIGTLYIVLTPSILVFTVSVLKETYSQVFMFLSLYVIGRYSRNILGKSSARSFLILQVILILGIIVSHYFTSILLIEWLFFSVILYFLEKVRKPYPLWGEASENMSVKLGLLSGIILSVGFIIYNFVIGTRLATGPMNIGDIITYMIYVAGVFTVYLLSPPRENPRASYLIILIIVVGSIAWLLISPNVVLGIDVYSRVLPLYAVPVIMGFAGYIWGVKRYKHRSLVHGLFLLVLVNFLYTLIGSPLLGSITHRFLQYLIIGNSIVLAAAASLGKRLSLFIAYAVLVTTISAGVLTSLNIINDADDLSYFWRYTWTEETGLNHINTLGQDLLFHGDTKIKYYYVTIRSIEEKDLVRFAVKEETTPNGVTILYKDNFRYGLMFELTRISIGENILSKGSLIYTNKHVYGLYGNEH